MFIEVTLCDHYNTKALLNVTCILEITPKSHGCYVRILNREDSFEIHESYATISGMLKHQQLLS